MDFKNIISWSPSNRAKNKEHENAVKKLVEIIKTQKTIYRKEIREWRMAQFAARNPEQPRRKLLIDLYEEIMDDAFVFARAETRILRVSNKDFVIKTNGEIDKEKTTLINKQWLTEFIKITLESNYYGYSLPFINELTDEGFIKSIDMLWRDHIVPEHCQILEKIEDFWENK